MSRRSPALLLIIVACTAQAAEHFDGKTWWDTVKEISDDKYEGRDTGSKGERQAQEYMVSKLKALGVEPAGSNGYFQSVKLRTVQIDEPHCTLSLVRDGQVQSLTLGEQAYFSTRYPLAPKVDAQLMFVGYGLNIPEKNYNDFCGPGSQEQGCGDPHRFARRCALGIECSLPIACRTVEGAQGRRRDRGHPDPKPRFRRLTVGQIRA